MKVNDRDFKDLVDNVAEMNTLLGRIEERVNAIHSSNGIQDAIMAKHEEKIEFLTTSVAQINVKLIALFGIGALAGGIISNIITKLTGF